jgi:type II secretory pathway pseudopilin PulG
MASRPQSIPRLLSRKPRPLSKESQRAGWSSGPTIELAADHKTKAFTVLDVVAAVAIIGILVLLAVPNFGNYLRKAQEVRCTANMRNITVALRGYLQDHGNVWPQGPSPEAGIAWENFWLGVLRSYGITDKTWQCPGIVARSEADAPRVHYTPTMFPPVPGIADRWATQPWLIERGEGHGHGALICFPDGSIKSFDKVMAELGAR